MSITLYAKLDMTPGAVPTVVHRSQYDSDFTLVFSLYTRTGDFVIASGTTARMRGTKTTGTGYSVPVTLDVSAKTVTVTGDQQMTAAAGANIFEIVLYQGDLEICSSNFILQVERAAMDADTITDETVVPELEHLEEYTQQAAEQAARDGAAYAQSWAVGGTGKREGEDTNNAKYWSEQAQGAVSGVASFNGRTGAVVPTTGDYKSEMIRRGNSTTTVEDTLTSLGNTATDLRSRMSTAEGTISSQGTRLSTAESDIDALETRATTAESNITTLQNNKVDMTTPLLNFDDTAVDPTTDDGALANALTALGILNDVILSGGGMLYLKKLLTGLTNHSAFGSTENVTVDTSSLPSGISYVGGTVNAIRSADGKTVILNGELRFNITAGVTSTNILIPTSVYLPARQSVLNLTCGYVQSFTWNASTSQLNLMQGFLVRIDTTGRVSFYMPSIYNNSGVLTRLFVPLQSVILTDSM